MKKISVFLVLLLSITFTLSSQTGKKVAVLTPEGSVMESIKNIVREEISNAIVNTPSYSVVERSMIEKVLEESRFQQGGLVDDAHISELGRMMGADYVCYGSISGIGNNYYMSLKMVDVVTARVIMQRTGTTQEGLNDVVSVTENLAYQLVNITGREPSTPQPATQPTTQRTTIPGSKMIVLVGVRPEPGDPVARRISDFLSSQLSAKYSVVVSSSPLTGTVRTICSNAVGNHKAGYVVLVTLSYSGRTFDYRAELFDTNDERRVFPVVSNKLSRRHYSEQQLAEEIWKAFENDLMR